MDNYVGRLLDNRYEIIEQIGIGGMAVVYKARDHRLKRLVAVKVLKEDLAQNDEFRRRFNAESQAVAMLSHPNIVSVYDVSEYDGVNFIVMELIDGITLKQYMSRRGMLNWRETLHFSTQITKALEHAHGRGIIHRDIKPHNIMILKDGSVKVADFGIARVSSSQHTLTREALGSVHYISPEQAKGGVTDCRSDIYSLGVVMYEMMTGKPPYDGESPVAVAIQHINGNAPLPRTVNSDIPLGMEQIIMHAMAADVSCRYASASDLLLDLEDFRKNPEILFKYVPAAAGTTAVQTATQTGAKAEPATKAAIAASKKKPANSKPKKKSSGEDESRKKLMLWVSLATGVLLVLLAVVFFIFLLPKLFNQSSSLHVPNFIGETADNIYPSDYPSFQFETKVEYDQNAEKGTVIAQEPEPYSSCEEGQLIILTISRGAQTYKMEDLRGKTVEEAEDILDTMDLKLSIQLEYIENAEIEKGQIVMTDPVEGIVLENGQRVVLYISMGVAEELVELKTVPKLVGYSIDSAIALLNNAKLELGPITEVENDALKGTVIAQSLEAGTTAQVGTKVNLTVSLGPAEKQDNNEESENTTSPENGSGSTGSNTDKPKTSNITVIITLGIDPEKVPGDVMVLSYYLDDVIQGVPEEVPCYDGDTPITELRYNVTITGTQKLTVYKINSDGSTTCIWSQYYTAE